MQQTLNRPQLMTMLEMQDAMNSRVRADWIQAGFPYLRAVVVEGSEAMEHHGWKWWKTQEKDLPQLQVELVDIWHFTLSAYLVWSEGDATLAANDILESLQGDGVIEFDGMEYVIDEMGLLDKIELMIGLAAAKRANVALFDSLLADCEMTWDLLFRQYVGKNTLNFFRQNNGYNDKPPTYRKMWAGREDNEHLVEIMTEIGVHDGFREELYRRLEIRYLETEEKEKA